MMLKLCHVFQQARQSAIHRLCLQHAEDHTARGGSPRFLAKVT
jgi:hypothetical protein